MNSTIMQLASKSGIKHGAQIHQELFCWEHNLVEFSGLMVQEMMRVLEENSGDMLPSKMAAQLKKHFGV